MVEEKELGKEVTVAIVAWVVHTELNFGHFLSNFGSKDMVEIEDIEQKEVETIGSMVKENVLEEE